MTTEEKARAYDNVLEKVTSFYKRCKECGADGTVVFLESTFPELAESEDERIRKWLEETIESMSDNNIIFNDVRRIDVLHWLEKQGEKDKLIKELGKYKVKYTQDVLCQQLEKQGEYTSSVGKYFITPEESLGISSDKYNKIVNDCIFGDDKKPQVDGFDAELNALLKKYERLPKNDIVECLEFYLVALNTMKDDENPKIKK